PDGHDRCPSASRASCRRRAPRRASWPCGCPGGRPPAGRRPPGGSGAHWSARRRSTQAARRSRTSCRPDRARRRSDSLPSGSGLLRGALDSRADEHEAALGAREGALDEHEALLDVDRVNGQVLDTGAVAAHAASHALTLEHATGGGGTADGTGLAVVAVLAVRRAHTGEPVALHDARGALALGGADDVDLLAGLEDRGVDLLAERVVPGVGGAQLDEVTARGHAGLLEVAAQRLGDLARVDLPVGDLHRVVAVGLDGADLGDDVRTGLHDGHGDELSVLVPDLGHAELGAEHAGHRSGLLAGQFVAHVHHPQSLISMLTSAGRSRRMSESTAFGVGSTMSIRRLCVRISKCSRESLYLCGERITQNTFFSVGSGTGPTTVAPALVTVSTILRAELSITSWSYDLSRMRIFCPAMASCLSSSSGMDAAAPGTRGRACRPPRGAGAQHEAAEDRLRLRRIPATMRTPRHG